MRILKTMQCSNVCWLVVSLCLVVATTSQADPVDEPTGEVGELVRVAGEADWPRQWEAFVRLAELGDPAAAGPLREMVRDESRSQWSRGRALVTLGRLRRSGDVEGDATKRTAEIAAAWTKGDSPPLRAAGVEYIGLMSEDTGWVTVRLALNDAEEEVRNAAVIAAARLGGDEAWRVVREAVSSERSSTRLAAVEALTHLDIDDPESNQPRGEALAALVADPDQAVAIAAARALSEYPAAAGVGPLVRLMADDEDDKRGAVARRAVLRFPVELRVPPLLKLLDEAPADDRVAQWEAVLSLLLETPTPEVASRVASRLEALAEADRRRLLPPAFKLLELAGGPPAAAAAAYVTDPDSEVSVPAVRAVRMAAGVEGEEGGVDLWEVYRPLLTPGELDGRYAAAAEAAAEVLASVQTLPKEGLTVYLEKPLTLGSGGVHRVTMGLLDARLPASERDQAIQLLATRVHGEPDDTVVERTLDMLGRRLDRRELEAIYLRDGHPPPPPPRSRHIRKKQEHFGTASTNPSPPRHPRRSQPRTVEDWMSSR